MQWKIDQVHVEDLIQRTDSAPNRPQKQTVYPAACNSDTVVNSTVTIYPIWTMKRNGDSTCSCCISSPMGNSCDL